MNPIKISATIITLNEEKNIERCVNSLINIADEIIIVDSYSTDKTKEICEKYPIKFIEHKFEGHIQQKNFAVSLANNNFVLSLDADEELSENLKHSIIKIKQNSTHSAYKFNRFTSYCGYWVKHCSWYPDKKIRLWDKNIAKWGGINPHDMIILNNDVECKEINDNILHYSFHSISQHIKQIDLFSEIASKSTFKMGKRSNYFLIIFNPLFKFIRDYIFKLGFLDGRYGFIICINSAYGTYLKYIKLYELQKINKN